ncbi:MAG: hypothetical protein WKF84_07415 [Pyrinomonadaceae bacterium]
MNLDQLRSEGFIASERLRSLSGTIASSTLGFVGGLLGAIVQIFFIIYDVLSFSRWRADS